MGIGDNNGRPARLFDCPSCGRITKKHGRCDQCMHPSKTAPLTIQQVAARLAVSKFDVKRLLRCGLLRAEMVGDVVRFHTAEVEEFAALSPAELADLLMLAEKQAS